MGVVTAIVKILQVPAVASLVERLTAKLFRNKGVDPKVTAFGLPLLIVEAVLVLAKQFDPGLGAVLEANRAGLLEVAALVGALLAYYTPNDKKAEVPK